jgi:serine/threonine protein kinase
MLCSKRTVIPLSKLRIEVEEDEVEQLCREFCVGDTTFRADGVSIGRDFLRIEGTTFTRGELQPDNLEMQDVIGRGAFSVVRRGLWRCEDRQRVVAVKTSRLLGLSRGWQKMMVKELRALCMLSHSALIEVHGAFLSGDAVTLVLAYMDCGALDTLLRTSAALRSSFTAAIAYQILDGLSYLHAKKVIHRDLKPSNVLLSADGSVKICDFGLASVQRGSDGSLNTTVLGTRKYMAPERLRAQAYGRSSDLWSFGLILLECVTGLPPWREVTSEIELLVTIEETDSRDLIPKGVEEGLREMIQVSIHRNPGTKALFR